MENNSRYEFFKIESVIPSLQMEYGLELDIFTVKELGYKCLREIGNVYETLYLFVGNVENGELELPCNVHNILHVTAEAPLNYNSYPQITDNWYNLNELPELKIKGNYVDFRYKNDKLYFYKDVIGYDTPDIKGTVFVLFSSQLLDEDRFPMITYREREAIAAYCYYIEMRKKVTMGLMNGQMLQVYQQDYKMKMSKARNPEKITSNMVDKLLEIRLGYNFKDGRKNNYGVV